MGDGRSEPAIGCAHRIDVDELPISRGFGKAVDALLIDDNPPVNTGLLPYPLVQLGKL